MAVDPVNAALEEAHKRLNDLLSQRCSIDKEIIDWKRVIDSLLAVSERANGDPSDPSDVRVSAFIENEVGVKAIKFTDGVRLVLSQNASREIPISAPEIRDQLTNLGFQFGKYAQPLVPIHNCLKRLAEQGEVSPVKNEVGQTLGYKWISPIERVLNDSFSFGDAFGPTTQRSANAFAERVGKVDAENATLRAAARRRADAIKKMKDSEKEN